MNPVLFPLFLGCVVSLRLVYGSGPSTDEYPVFSNKHRNIRTVDSVLVSWVPVALSL